MSLLQVLAWQPKINVSNNMKLELVLTSLPNCLPAARWVFKNYFIEFSLRKMTFGVWTKILGIERQLSVLYREGSYHWQKGGRQLWQRLHTEGFNTEMSQASRRAQQEAFKYKKNVGKDMGQDLLMAPEEWEKPCYLGVGASHLRPLIALLGKTAG